MPAHPLLFVLMVFSLTGGVAGCAGFGSPSKQLLATAPPVTPEQQQWWAENRPKARYVPGRGYYVEGTSGYFDESGRKLPSDPNSTTGLVTVEEKESAA